MSNKETMHDLPRIAKESGFFFHLRNRKINWEDIAHLDVEEIANSRNFALLEEKMNLVINCDLNDEVTKVLDRDFVKLFRLAQLSISYLLHCQWCLDRCVLMLQDQLAAFVKESDASRAVRNDQGRNDKPIHRCTECEKTFLSESYLTSHQQRRHNTKRMAESGCQTESAINNHSKGQQTDEIKSLSFGLQTELVRTQNVGVMTDHPESHQEEERNMELLERLKAIEEEIMAKCRESGRDISRSRAEECNRTDVRTLQENNLLNHETRHETTRDSQQPQIEMLHKDVTSLTTIVHQLVPLIQNLQHQPAQDVNKESADTIQIEMEAPTEATDSKEDIIDLGTPLLQARNDQEPSPEPEQKICNESRETRHITRKKVYKSQEPEVTEQAPKPTPRSKHALRKQKSMTVEEQQATTPQRQEEVKIIENVNVAQQIAEEALRKVLGSMEKMPGAKPTQSDSHSDVTTFHKRNEMAWPEPGVSGRSYWSSEDKSPTVDNREKEEVHKVVVEEPIIKEKKQENKSPKKSFFRNLVKAPKLKGIKSSLKKSWSNLYEASRRKQEDVRDLLMDRSKSEISLLSDRSKDDVITLMESRLKDLGLDPEWRGIPDETLDRAMLTLQHDEEQQAKVIPGYAIIREVVERSIDEEVKLLSRKSNNEAGVETSNLKMYDSTDSGSEDYNATIIESPIADVTMKNLEKSFMINREDKERMRSIKLSVEPLRASSQESSSSESPIRVISGNERGHEAPGISNKGVLLQSPLRSTTQDYKISGIPSIDDLNELLNSDRSSVETNFYNNSDLQSPLGKEISHRTTNNVVRGTFLTKESVKYTDFQTSGKESITKIIKKPVMYSVEDSSSIESIEDTPPKASTRNEQKTPTNLEIGPLSIGPQSKRDTDFSIFQAGNKSLAGAKLVASSESEDEIMKTEPFILKSSLQSKSREVRKRVVFADNFPLEVNAASSALLNIPEADSGSDWDISI